LKGKNVIISTFANRAAIKHGVPQGQTLRLLLFLPYINDLSVIINGKSKPVLFADDISLTFTNSNLEGFKHDIKILFEYLNK
jgi:hypothetical protein